jgi:hypothetical protein
VGASLEQEMIAVGREIRELPRLRKSYGLGGGANARVSLGGVTGAIGATRGAGAERRRGHAEQANASAAKPILHCAITLRMPTPCESQIAETRAVDRGALECA